MTAATVYRRCCNCNKEKTNKLVISTDRWRPTQCCYSSNRRNTQTVMSGTYLIAYSVSNELPWILFCRPSTSRCNTHTSKVLNRQCTTVNAHKLIIDVQALQTSPINVQWIATNLFVDERRQRLVDVLLNAEESEWRFVGDNMHVLRQLFTDCRTNRHKQPSQTHCRPTSFTDKL